MAHMRILIVDDHEVVRLGLRSLLEHLPDFEVVADVGTAEDAVKLALAHRPDVVLMDIRLPGESGIEACQRITRQIPDTKVIMLTSYAQDEMLFAAIRAGATGYVLKQVGSDDLVKAIRGAARGEASLDPALTQRIFTEVRQAIRNKEASAFSALTEQEMRVLALVAEGKTNRDIAKGLFLGEGTVRNYVSNLLAKLQLSNRAEAAAYAVEHNLKDFLSRE
jgi:DNA-binding NarL/FixJ family response regulator